MTPAQHNATRGQALTVAVVDYIRACHATGTEVSMWAVGRHVCNVHKVTGRPERLKVYERVRTTLHSLRDAGLVSMAKTWRPDLERTINIITYHEHTGDRQAAGQ